MRHIKRRRQILQRVENFVGNPAWDDFVDWCKRQNLTPLPANAWTLAAYLRSLEGNTSLVQIRKCVADIGKAHAEKSKRRPERHQLIKKTLEIIEERAETRESPAQLFDDDFASPKPPKLKKPTVSKTKPTSDQTKKPKSRVMRSSPKLVTKRRPK